MLTKTPVRAKTPKFKSVKRPPTVTEALLTDVTRRIVDEFNPHQVILFGSRAWGEPRPDSDIDLMVIMDSDERPGERRVRVSNVASVPPVPMDLLVYTPEEIATRQAMRDFFILRILERGRPLYS